jgi:hypothetical protein
VLVSLNDILIQYSWKGGIRNAGLRNVKFQNLFEWVFYFTLILFINIISVFGTYCVTEVYTVTRNSLTHYKKSVNLNGAKNYNM